MEILSGKKIDRFFYAVIHSLIAELDEGRYLARMYSDVTERKEASEALEQLTKNLEIEVLERTQ
ncbi:MAG: hypothetical protein NTX05_04175 [Fusobacteria bacterium]|nr:hypothetical protein [Fusobacteriota bacterium]